MASLGDHIGINCPVCARRLQVPITTRSVDKRTLEVALDGAFIKAHLLTHTHWDGEPISDAA